MGFEKFENLKECVEECEWIAKEIFPNNPGQPWRLLTGTPLESLFGSKDVNIDGVAYDVIGWGGQYRSTPWGLLPQVILAVRTDISRVIEARPDVEKCMELMSKEVREKMKEWFPEEKKPLMGKDWQPAPGFERPW